MTGNGATPGHVILTFAARTLVVTALGSERERAT